MALVEKFRETSLEFAGIITAIRAFIDKFVKTYTDEIVNCETEADFFKMIAELGDELYQGNVITETIDYEVFKFMLTKGIDPLLDKTLGKDWFIVLKSQAINLQLGVEKEVTITPEIA